MNTCTMCHMLKPDAQPLDIDYAVIVICDNCTVHFYDAAAERVARIKAEWETWND